MPGMGLSHVDSLFFSCFIDLGLTQWVAEPTYYSPGNILDLILTLSEDNIGEVKTFPPFSKLRPLSYILYVCVSI